MGVLDDAIRQHIELKRQHGASEDDLRVQEQEALGPIRREPAAPPLPEEVQPPGESAMEHAPLDASDLDAEPLEALPPEAFTREAADRMLALP